MKLPLPARWLNCGGKYLIHVRRLINGKIISNKISEVHVENVQIVCWVGGCVEWVMLGCALVFWPLTMNEDLNSNSLSSEMNICDLCH